jgi:hypothetical protein
MSTAGEWTVERHLADQPDASVALYHRFVALVATCGPFEYVVSKTTVTFRGTRRGFAGARPDRQGVRGYLDLQRVINDPRITTATPYTTRLFVHHFRIREAADLDETFAGWVAEAYAVGAGEHLGGSTPP